MRTLHFSSCGLSQSRAPLRVCIAALWLACAVLLAPVWAVNTPPVLVTAQDQTVNEGQLLDLSSTNAPPLGFYVDPDLADSHTAVVEWGDGTPNQSAQVFPGLGSGSLGGSHSYADNGIFTVAVTVADSAGGTDDGLFSVAVKNVVPIFNLTPSFTTVVQGQSLNFTANLADPGFYDLFRYHVDWGDGVGTIATQDVTDIVNGAPGTPLQGTFGGSHTYANGGAYTVTVRLADDDMGAYANSALFLSGAAGSEYVQYVFPVQVLTIPEPAAIVLTTIGLACLLMQRRRQMS